jgi:uncharacterized protein YjiS (DUF1127 family)
LQSKSDRHRRETVAQWRPRAMEAMFQLLEVFVMDDLLRAGSAAGPIDRVLATVRQWRQRTRSRRELAGLDEYQTRDFGVSRAQAKFESGKRFWQA